MTYLVFHVKGGRVGSTRASVASLFNAARAFRRVKLRLHVLQRDISGTIHFNVTQR